MGNTIDTRPDLTMDEIKAQSMRMWCATSVGVVTCDGLGALGAASGLLAGLVGRARGTGGQTVLTSMLASSAYAVSDDAVEYVGRAEGPAADLELHGFGALYRLYPASDGWVFLAAPAAHEWEALTAALAEHIDLAGDARFATQEVRERHDAELADALTGVFAKRSAADWEKHLTVHDVACVVAETKPAEAVLMSDEFGRAGQYVVDVDHPLFETIPRLAPLVRFSRSATTAKPGCLLGQHTDAVLAELGYDADRIRTLHEQGIVGG
jgi:crotonobetainyl-CoA:carnitine CoA-transferase CaiB-like acyl-CoA transferase